MHTSMQKAISIDLWTSLSTSAGWPNGKALLSYSWSTRVKQRLQVRPLRRSFHFLDFKFLITINFFFLSFISDPPKKINE